MNIQIHGIDKALRGIDPKIAEKALRMGINDAARYGRTHAGREIRKVWNIKADRVRKEIKTIKLARTGDLDARIQAKGRPISLIHFGAKGRSGAITTTAKKSTKGKRTLRNQGVTVQVEKGKQTRMPNAFIATMKNGNMGVFQRLGKTRLPIASRATVTIATMLGQDRVYNPVRRIIEERLTSRTLHHLKRLGL